MTFPSALAVVSHGDWRLQTPDHCQVIIEPDALRVDVPPADRIFGIYSDRFDTLNMALQWGKLLNKRVVANDDGGGLYPESTLRELKDWQIPTMELYVHAGESLHDAIERWDDAFADLLRRWPYDIGAVLLAYTQNGRYTESQVREIAAEGVKAINRYGPRVKLALPFAWNRADGVKSVVADICAATPGQPIFRPVNPPVPPVTIHASLVPFFS